MGGWKSGKCAFCGRSFWSGSHDPSLGRPKCHIFVNRDLLRNVSSRPSAWSRPRLVPLPDVDAVGLPVADDRLDIVAAA